MERILVVDDDASYADPLSQQLREFGFSPIRFDNGSAALEYCRQHLPDLVILDWCLESDISGQAVLQALKAAQRTREIPVVVVSGKRSAPSDERAALAAGARFFFVKDEIDKGLESGRAFERHLRALLPATSAAPASSVAPPRLRETKGSSDAYWPLAPTILVIDDQEDTAGLLTCLFKNARYRFQWAGSGKQGLSRLSTEFPDLVVLDLHMPDMDGMQICRALREKSAADSLYLPVLMLTGDARLERQVQCLNVGADDYLVKPAPNDLMIARINNLLRRHRFRLSPQGGISVGDVALDCDTHQLSIAGERAPIALTKAETGILLLLMSAEGRPVDLRILHKKICRSSTIPDPRSSTLKSHISHIRAKLGRHGALIAAVNGEAAYRFDAEAATIGSANGA